MSIALLPNAQSESHSNSLPCARGGVTRMCDGGVVTLIARPNSTIPVGCGALDAPRCSRCGVTIKQCGRAWKPAPTIQSTKTVP